MGQVLSGTLGSGNVHIPIPSHQPEWRKNKVAQDKHHPNHSIKHVNIYT